jgi:RNA polymerase sigma factor (sigma-70 family)
MAPVTGPAMEKGSMSESEKDFSTLMQCVREGSPDATRELLDRYGPHVLRVVRRKLNRKLRTKFDSLDFVQDVWASFFTASPQQLKFDRPEDLIAYLVSLARNKVIEEFRQRVQTKKRAVDRERSLDGSAAVQVDHLVARQPTPSQIVVAKELWDQLLEGQPAHYQQMLVLLRQGVPRDEIARELGLNERTVRRVLDKLAPEPCHDP